MERAGSKIRKFVTFSQKKAFLIFLETETCPKLFIFQETELSNISGNKNPKKTSYISGSNFQSSKNEKTRSEKISYISENGAF